VATGKPDPTMHRESVQRSGATRPIVVGDRLDTDIEGAERVGCPSLLVLTGVTSARDLLEAPTGQRPDFIAHDLSGLLQPHPEPANDANQSVTCGGWRAEQRDGALELALSGSGGGDAMDALRALCAVAWQATGGSEKPAISAGDDAAARVLRELGLDAD
jgi:hypothetical protein